MKNYLKSTLAFSMALSMLTAPALAQQDQHDNGQNGQHMMDQHSTMQHAPAQHQDMQHQDMQHQYTQHQTMQPPHRQMALSHHWQHGQHYNGSRRVVNNWQYYHLRQPPHGYEWVQDGGQFVLIAVASGIIADVIANALSQ